MKGQGGGLRGTRFGGVLRRGFLYFSRELRHCLPCDKGLVCNMHFVWMSPAPSTSTPELPLLQLYRLLAHGIQEGPVVADHQQRLALTALAEVLLHTHTCAQGPTMFA